MTLKLINKMWMFRILRFYILRNYSSAFSTIYVLKKTIYIHPRGQHVFCRFSDSNQQPSDHEFNFLTTTLLLTEARTYIKSLPFYWPAAVKDRWVMLGSVRVSVVTFWCLLTAGEWKQMYPRTHAGWVRTRIAQNLGPFLLLVTWDPHGLHNVFHWECVFYRPPTSVRCCTCSHTDSF